MMTPMQLFRRLAAVLRGKVVERDMDAEMSFHLEMEAAEHQRAEDSRLTRLGAARTTRLAAWSDFVREGRDARGVGPARDLAGDLRSSDFASCVDHRCSRRSPWARSPSASASTAPSSRSSTRSCCSRSRSPTPESLVSVWDGGHSLAEFTYIRDRSRTLESVATYFPNYGVSLSGVDEPMRLTSAQVSAGFFDVLRVGSLAGAVLQDWRRRPGCATAWSSSVIRSGAIGSGPIRTSWDGPSKLTGSVAR